MPYVPKVEAAGINNSIQFNSIIYYLCAESTALRPITDTAQSNNNNNKIICSSVSFSAQKPANLIWVSSRASSVPPAKR
jgi:hypothetical protein